MFLHYSYSDLYRKQVVKQADLVLAMQLRPDLFTPDQTVRNFDYYERITVRDSSLSACTQAVLAAQTGLLDLAYAYVAESSLVDLDDLEHNTKDGLHMAALAGSWIALVSGLGGLETNESRLSFHPRLPDNLHQLRFRVLYRGRRLLVRIDHGEAGYQLVEGADLTVWHYEEEVPLKDSEEVVKTIAPPPRRTAPVPPKGREPRAR